MFSKQCLHDFEKCISVHVVFQLELRSSSTIIFKDHHIVEGRHNCQLCAKSYANFHGPKSHYMSKHKDQLKDVFFPNGIPITDAEATQMRIANDLPRSRRTAELINLNATSANIVNLQFNYPLEIVYPDYDDYDYDFLGGNEPTVEQGNQTVASGDAGLLGLNAPENLMEVDPPDQNESERSLKFRQNYHES